MRYNICQTDVITLKEKKRKDKYSAVYIMAAALLIGILLYAGFKALQIYIPQSNADHNFENLKNQVGLDDVNADGVLFCVFHKIFTKF